MVGHCGMRWGPGMQLAETTGDGKEGTKGNMRSGAFSFGFKFWERGGNEARSSVGFLGRHPRQVRPIREARLGGVISIFASLNTQTPHCRTICQARPDTCGEQNQRKCFERTENKTYPPQGLGGGRPDMEDVW